MPLPLLSLLLHGYIGWRLVPAMGPAALQVGVGLLVALSAATLPFAFGPRSRRGSGALHRRLSWIGLVCLGLFSSLFVFTVMRDLGLAVATLVAAIAPGVLSDASLPVLVHRSAQAVVIAAVGVTAWGYANARRTARIARVDVPIAGLPPALHGFRIAQLSDVHVGATIRRDRIEAVVDRVNDEQVDLVAITGDLVDGSVADLGSHVAPLADLRSKDGTFFVTGNHEYYSGAAAWIAELRRLGLRVLLNEHAVVRRGDAKVVVAGVTDWSAGHFDRSQASDPGRAIAGAPGDAAVRLLLAHQPRSAPAAEAAGFDLQLSGHTHGGQFWPWNHFVRLQQPFTAGLHRLKRMWVYTSRGTGYWGPPKRFGAPSEITVLRFVPAVLPRGA